MKKEPYEIAAEIRALETGKSLKDAPIWEVVQKIHRLQRELVEVEQEIERQLAADAKARFISKWGEEAYADARNC